MTTTSSSRAGLRLCFWLSAIAQITCLQTPKSSPSTTELLHQVKQLIQEKDSDRAFSVLMDIYSLDPTLPGLKPTFESCLRLQVEADETDAEARFGLVSLLLDQERFEEASNQLQHVIGSDDPYIREKSASQLFRTNAAMCNWETVARDGQAMASSLRLEERTQKGNDPKDVPLVHPFEALKWPYISLSDCTQIAGLYARRSAASQGIPYYDRTISTGRVLPSVDVVKSKRGNREGRTSSSSSSVERTSRKIRLGYVSPDFTGSHPMAFLIQSIFQYHDRDQFSVHVYSLGTDANESPEVDTIRNGSDTFSVLSLGESPARLAERIRQDGLDILIDLCGYTGTSKVAELLSHRPSDLQIAYMGFPASSGAPFIDYMIADQIVVPPSLRKHYTEGMIWMPNCYFVNSHTFCAQSALIKNEAEYNYLRARYNLPANSIVFCSHNRPDKIDCTTFEIWLQALTEIRRGADPGAVLWMLRSGAEMEKNLRRQAREDFGLSDDALVFCDIAPREDHLRRLGCADVFLDTPSYNAHTVGCDTLFAGVPMISLLRPIGAQNINDDPCFVPTEKLASRVGASLLSSVDLEDFIAQDLTGYKNLMIKCASEPQWFRKRAEHLHKNRFSFPLFDTQRWVENLDSALLHLVLNDEVENDILIKEADFDIARDALIARWHGSNWAANL